MNLEMVKLSKLDNHLKTWLYLKKVKLSRCVNNDEHELVNEQNMKKKGFFRNPF